MKILIKEQFCGPPGTANGGYLCGVLAKEVGTWPVEITLRKPIPIERELEVKIEGEGLRLYDGAELLAGARPAPLEMEVPKPPTFEEARQAAKGFLGFHRLAHPYKRCFVCGPGRHIGDGMRIFAGPTAKGRAATVWTPEVWMGDEDGLVSPEFVLGALDCPGYFAHYPKADQHALLGRMTAEILGGIKVDEDYIVLGWTIGVEGKKHFVGTALFNAGGICVARAKSIWFPVDV